MSAMDRNTLRSLLQKMEKETQKTLFRDGSFLEALQALKWQVDSDARVRAATRALQDCGTTAFTSFVPRIRLRLQARKTALALPREGIGASFPDTEEPDRVSQIPSEPLTHELCDAASAAVAASPYCRHLDAIVNEAVQANGHFERLAAAVARAGYELRMSVDLSVYAQVRERGLTAAPSSRHPAGARQSMQLHPADEPSRLTLSGPDMQFLKDLHIRLD